MHNFLIHLLEKKEEPFEIAFLNVFHILYFAIILAFSIGLAFYIRKHSDKTESVLRALTYSLIVVYVADIFLQPFVSSDFTMNIDKLPFHLCTVLCPISAFVQFNKKFEKFAEPVAFLAAAASIMYIVYPGSAIGEISPFCYKILQTFIFHGILLAWAICTLASGKFTPKFKNCYKPLILLAILAVWATFGNFAYNTAYAGGDGNHHYDWLFLTGSSFGMSPYIMPFLSIAAIYGTTLCVYGIYFGWVKIMAKMTANKAIKEAATK